jgi:hypothetical protein
MAAHSILGTQKESAAYESFQNVLLDCIRAATGDPRLQQ